MKKFLMFLFIILASVSLAACGKTPEKKPEPADTDQLNFEAEAKEVKVENGKVVFKDGKGEERKITQNPSRIAPIYNSHLNLVVEAGGRDKIVARVEAKDDKKTLSKDILEDEKILKVGKNTGIDLEKLTTANPDLVIFDYKHTKQDQIQTILDKPGVEYYTVKNTNLKEYLKFLRVISLILDNEKAYNDIRDKVLSDVYSVINAVKGQKPVKMSLLFLNAGKSNSIKGYNDLTTNGEMIKYLGGVNFFAGKLSEKGGNSVTISEEELLVFKPEVIFIQVHGDQEAAKKWLEETYIPEHAYWSKLPAVKNDRVFVLEKDLFHYKPNQRYGEAYKVLASRLYPELELPKLSNEK